MADYKTLYRKLFNNVSEVIEELQKVQLETEELYMEAQDTELLVLDSQDGGSEGKRQ